MQSTHFFLKVQSDNIWRLNGVTEEAAGVRLVRWPLSTSDSTTQYRNQWTAWIFKILNKFRRSGVVWGNDCFGFFGCQWRNEWSVQSAKFDVSVEQILSISDDPLNFFRIFLGKFGTSQSASSCRIRHKNARQLLEFDAETVRSATHVTSSSTWSQNEFSIFEKEAPPTGVKEGASLEPPASWLFRPFELKLRNEMFTVAFSTFDSTWLSNFINFVRSADFLPNFHSFRQLNHFKLKIILK
jgi:hypothetical protein